MKWMASMKGYIVLRQVRLSDKHKPTGGTRHYKGSEVLPPASQLWIARYPDDLGYYLLYLDANGNELTDTYHDSLDEAIAQASWEFNVQPSEWSPAPGN
jgi:hypothetical protein